MGCLGNSKTAEDQGVDEKERREANKKIEKQLQKERLAYKATHRLLLLGKAGGRAAAPGRSGAHSPERGERGGRAGRTGRGPPSPPPATGTRSSSRQLACTGKCPRWSRVITVWVGRRDGNGIGPRSTAFFFCVCRGWRVWEEYYCQTNEDPACQWI